jgi:uncharacterized protein YkwD
VGAAGVDPKNRNSVANFYSTEYMASEGVSSGWNGNVSSCQAGTISSAYRAAGLRRMNYFRAMAGLPPINATDPVLDAKCQEAALMMSANNSLSHSPPASWTCYTAAGAEAAGKSNLGLGYSSLPTEITALVDDAPISSAGHRRWILYPPQVSTGLGAVTSGARGYAMWVIGTAGSRPPSPEWVAWPPEGYLPYQLSPALWTFSYPGANFAGTTVSMVRAGVPLAVVLEPIQNGYGDNTIVWQPQGLGSGGPGGDVSFQVTLSNVIVSGSPRTFTYTVTIIDPAVVPTVPVTWGSLKHRFPSGR